VLIDYEYISHSLNESMEFLGILAVEGFDRNKELKLPKELDLLCSDIVEGAATAGRGSLANK